MRIAVLATLLVLVGCASSPPPAQSPEAPLSRAEWQALEKKLDHLGERLSEMEKKLEAPTRQWSCAARCLSGFSCKASGDSNVDWKDVTGKGASAADAFKALTEQCHKVLYVSGQCREGSFERTDATLTNACVRD